MIKTFIIAAKRTPIGSFGGALKNLPAQVLAQTVIEKLLQDTNIDANDIDEVILGCVLQAGLGQNVARQAACNAQIPHRIPAMTINQVCGSGLRSVTLGAQTIQAGDNHIVIAGGMENMSRAPYYMEQLRWGAKMGDTPACDSLLNDALTDAFYGIHMGITAENIAAKYGVTRIKQDEFAAHSQRKAQTAIEQGLFADEIVSVNIPQKKSSAVLFNQDEYPRFDTNAEKLAKLTPVFKTDGTVTAGNASGINDGAAALILMSAQKSKQLDIKPMAEIISYAAVGVDPQLMGMGPVESSRKAMKKAGLSVNDIGLFEVNEAFAAQSIAVISELGLDTDKVNINGGAIALGHPVGASGARILTTLLYQMKRTDTELGLATLCVGGGMGVTVIVRNMQ